MTKKKTPEEKAAAKAEKANLSVQDPGAEISVSEVKASTKKTKVQETRFVTNAGTKGRVKSLSM